VADALAARDATGTLARGPDTTFFTEILT